MFQRRIARQPVSNNRKLRPTWNSALKIGLITPQPWRALVHESLNRFEEADNQRAIELDPADANTCTNLANVLQDLGLFVLVG